MKEVNTLEHERISIVVIDRILYFMFALKYNFYSIFIIENAIYAYKYPYQFRYCFYYPTVLFNLFKLDFEKLKGTFKKDNGPQAL